MKNENRIPINNNQYIRVSLAPDCVYIYREDICGGTLEKVEKISGGDFVSMLNWYHYQKQNGNAELIF